MLKSWGCHVLILSTDDALKFWQGKIYNCLQMKLHHPAALSLPLVETRGKFLHQKGVWRIMLSLL